MQITTPGDPPGCISIYYSFFKLMSIISKKLHQEVKKMTRSFQSCQRTSISAFSRHLRLYIGHAVFSGIMPFKNDRPTSLNCPNIVYRWAQYDGRRLLNAAAHGYPNFTRYYKRSCSPNIDVARNGGITYPF